MLKTKYEEIVNVTEIGKGNYNGAQMNEVMLKADKEVKVPADKDSVRVGLMLIDCQGDFINQEGALPVAGACEDMERVTQFIYKNLTKITRIYCTMDWHKYGQIFFPNAWKNLDGDNPAPGTIITYQDVKDGKWIFTLGPITKAVTYLKQLEAKGYVLIIWPYHCIENTPGSAIEVELAKMLNFHSAVRDSKPKYFFKGTDPFTEMYGVIEGEYDENNFVNWPVLNCIENEVDVIYIAGEAGSHCVLRSLQQIVARFANRPEILKKIKVLSDCTSPIGGFEKDMEDGFKTLKNDYGVEFVKSIDVDLN